MRFLFLFLLASILLGVPFVNATVFEFEGRSYFVHVENPNRSYYGEIMKIFHAALLAQSSISGELKECEKVIDLPVGTAKGNHSYGGICTLDQGGKEIKFIICADIMVGHQVMQFGGILSQERLAKFVALNCFGG